MQNNCATTSLAPYSPSSEDWTSEKIRHLYRRLGYGANAAQIENALAKSPSELVDELMQEAINATQPETPFWADWTSDDYEDNDNPDYEHYKDTQNDWIRRGFESPFLAKMSLFWHDHFATEREKYYCNTSMWYYYKLLHQRSFGNFRTFVEEMGINKAMLIYLDGYANFANEPNENYARELMELFTMGEGNGYTQMDIEEVARALTGYRMKRYDCTDVYYDASRHDNGAKTIFGQSGNFNYADVHELIFTLRADKVATYICSKLYQHFVYYEPNKEVVAQMAAVFKTNNWELAPVLNLIFKSEHFFDESLIGSRIKHPKEVLISLLSPLGVEIGVDVEEGLINYVNNAMRRMGMDLFDPPNVAGWSGHRVWLSEIGMTFRWTFTGTILQNYFTTAGKEKLRELAIKLGEGSNDPAYIANVVTDHWLSVPLDNDQLEVATLYLRAGIPDNYFDDGSWNLYWEEAPDQLINLLSYIIQIPEFQLA